MDNHVIKMHCRYFESEMHEMNHSVSWRYGQCWQLSIFFSFLRSDMTSLLTLPYVSPLILLGCSFMYKISRDSLLVFVGGPSPLLTDDLIIITK